MPVLERVVVSALFIACGEGAPPAKVWVANERAGTVSVFEVGGPSRTDIDLTERRPDGVVGYNAHNVQASPDGRRIWATANPASLTVGGAYVPTSQLIGIDATTNAVRERIALERGTMAAHVVVDPSARFAYVTLMDLHAVAEIDVTAGAVSRRFRLGAGRAPHGLRWCAGRLFVANTGGRSLSIVDLGAGSNMEVALGGAAVQSACTRDGRWAFASLNDTREVARVEVSSGTVSRLALGSAAQGPIQIHLSTDERRLYVADQGRLAATPTGRLLYEIDVGAWSVARFVDVGRGPHGVAVSSDGATVFVTNTDENNVAVIDARTFDVVRRVDVGAGPNGITCYP
jgi:YVTN family beta-propeller protein